MDIYFNFSALGTKFSSDPRTPVIVVFVLSMAANGSGYSRIHGKKLL